ncbi:hypothetical protein MMC17_010000 [Xylographa soralifera]|nr:hypothetical protein [Xylographa soralifera]
MRLLLDRGDGNLNLEEYDDNNIPRYAILSHTWGANGEEVTFKDLMEGTGKNKAGYKKIKFCRNQAASDGLQHFWVDTCCIDKSSSAELTEAINSMYRWYQHADKCYVYLLDVSLSGDATSANSPTVTWEAAFRRSRWFRRGWTLQELIAPASVEFFSQEADRLGDKRSLEQTILEITKIPVKALRGAPLAGFEVEERMSWATHRDTKKQEDGAYSLLGLFDVHMPLIYGEGGEKAFVRLREEVSKSSKHISTKHVERRDLLLSLERHLTPGTSTTCGGKRVVLVGMSGSGKTELAARFVKLQRHNYVALLWLDCSSERSLENSFTRIAEKLSRTTFQDSKKCRSFCQDWLCDHQNWLLIADRLDDEETLRSFQTEFMSLGMEGDILATSTNFSLALVWTSVEVGNMSLSESLELLRKILGDSLSRPGNGQDELVSLVKELGYLALAINQAGCYIRQQALTAAEYHQLLQKQGPLSLVQGSILPYPPSHLSLLWTAFELSFERLQEADRRASQLLFLLTMLKSEEIELDLLLSHAKFQGHWAVNGEFEEVPQAQRWIPCDMENVFHERYVLLEAVAGLRRFAFVRLNETDMSISLHPLIQSWSLHKMSRQEGLIDSFKSCAIGVVCSKLIKQDIFPPFLLRPSRLTHVEERKLSPWPWRQYHDLSRYALQCLQYTCELPRIETTTASQGLALLQFLEYSSFGSYVDQYTLGQEVLKSVEKACDRYTFDPDDFLRVSVLVWRLVRALKCTCRKTGPRCRECTEAHHAAVSLYESSSLHWRTKRFSASLRCLRQVLVRSDLPTPPHLAAHTLPSEPSWIEKYLVANSIFQVVTLGRQVEYLSYIGEGEEDLGKAVLYFRQLGELDSDEHRRSLWHLTTYWWHKGLWNRIINALEPLVESSLKQPVSDWSHERCIIRLVSALLKLDRLTEAMKVLHRAKKAYEAYDKSLRTIQNSSLLNELQVDRLKGVSLTSANSHGKNAQINTVQLRLPHTYRPPQKCHHQ